MRARRGPASDATRGSRGRRAPVVSRRVRCARRRTEDLLGEIGAVLREARGGGREAVVVLEDAGGIAGSASTFLKELARLLVDHPGVVTLRDPSGYAAAFVDLWDLRPGRGGERGEP